MDRSEVVFFFVVAGIFFGFGFYLGFDTGVSSTLVEVTNRFGSY